MSCSVFKEAKTPLRTISSCECLWCSDCLTTALQSAAAFERNYQVYCHYHNTILQDDSALGKAAKGLVDKMMEYDVYHSQRIYTMCCAAFLRRRLDKVPATWPKCSKDVCAVCGRGSHGHTAYKIDQMDEETQKLIADTTKRCPGCTILVQKVDGCNHM